MINLAIVIVFVEISKEIPVDDADRVVLLYERNRLVDILYLIVVRMRFTIGTYEAINTERAVIRLIAKITTI